MMTPVGPPEALNRNCKVLLTLATRLSPSHWLGSGTPEPLHDDRSAQPWLNPENAAPSRRLPKVFRAQLLHALTRMTNDPR